MELRGAVAVVTGASSGFGELTAKLLASEGANVALAARRAERLEGVAEQIAARGGSAVVVPCDVTKLADLEELRDRVDEAYGRCDVLVNNAGIPGGGPLIDLSFEAIEQVVRVNLLAVMLCTRVFLPMMLEQGRGHIVNVASLSGRFAAPGASVYGATKRGVIAFSEALYYELGPKGILVTSVNPGFAVTERFPQTHRPKAILMKPEKVAAAIVDTVKKGKAPQVTVPRAVAPLEALRILTPPLYRWGVRKVTSRFSATRAK
ncbi:MAG: SDR family NAD(P)-dependent oxidoreductase [Actinomycetota bacterium]